MANIKDMGLPRHTWDTPPFLLIVSPTLPVQSVDAYVRTYARSVTWQPNEKRLTIFYEYGALFHARFASEGAPLKIVTKWREIQKSKLDNSLTNWVFEIFFFTFVSITSRSRKTKNRNRKTKSIGFFGIQSSTIYQLFACVLAQRAIFGN